MPYFLLQPIHYAWLQTVLVTIKSDYADFLTYRAQQLKNATINSQVNRLTQALWDEFGNTTIYILHPDDNLAESFIYLESEGATPEFDYLESEDHTPVDYDYLESEYANDYDFIVRIPVSMAASTEAVYAFVAPYIFSGINFTVQTF